MSLKKSSFICLLIISFLWLATDIIAQRGRSAKRGKRVEQSSKSETRVRKPSPAPAPPKSIQRTPAASHQQKRNRVETQPRRVQNDFKVERRKDVEVDRDLRKRKYNLNRPKRTTPNYQPKPQTKRRKPKQHKMDNTFYNDQLEDYVYVEEHYEELYPICGVVFNEIGNIYPAFPLRFIDVNINYLFTERTKIDLWGTKDYSSSLTHRIIEKDIYEINISVKPERFNYWDMFGVLIQFNDGGEQIVFFNEKEELLENGYVYNFSKEIELKQIGHMKLTLGYYDSFDDIFYPAISYGKRTEIWIYVGRGIAYETYD
ncbi:MAG: hypothetical protein HND52_16130 [Ignavibacteriae bacterium]|jgi:hypothetical protein|nr:hypothetical protein [Ignavibacteriota bacterium]NOG99485.1 hypothetical protein [Ignavibacteriota bacterium]